MSDFKFDIGDIVEFNSYNDKDNKIVGIIRYRRIGTYCENDPLYFIEVLSGRLRSVQPHDCEGYVPNGNGYKISESNLRLIKKKQEITLTLKNRLRRIFGHKLSAPE